MNKTLIAIIVVAALAIAFFMINQKQPSTPAPETISGTLPTAVQEEPEMASEVAAVPADLISSAPSNADVFFLEPGDGTTVSSPVTLKFGITGMQVAPAGSNIENSGHHHLLINMDELPAMDQPLPATDQLIHFGAGQTEVTLDLDPGEYTFQLVLGNYLHIPHNPPVVSKKISLTVE